MTNHRSLVRHLFPACSVVAVFMLGCAGEPKQSGFLSTYDNLQQVTPTFRRYLPPGNEIRAFSKFMIDPIETRLSGSQSIDPKDEQHLKQYMYQVVRQELSKNYTLVSDPGPGVARIRIAITNLRASSPAMQMTPGSKLAGVGGGGAAVEVELVDSQTGKQIAAAIDTETGSPFSTSRRSEWGQVEEVMNDWAKRLARRIDEAHSSGATK
jgi:hypothetical protein